MPRAFPDPRSRAAADHWDGRRFFNPHADTDKSLRDVLAYWRAMRASSWAPPADAPLRPLPDAPQRGVSVTLLGHATLLVRLGGAAFLTDPLLGARAGPLGLFGPRRVRPPAWGAGDLPAVDAVLVSHDHYDHLCLPSLRALARRGAPFAATGLGNGARLRRAGFRAVAELDWWEEADGPHGTRIAFVPAQHWSSRGLFDRRRTLWGGFVVRAPDATLYFAGDTGHSPHFAEIRERFGPVDVALLPIGAYEPREFMRAQHMNPDDAVRAHIALGAARSVAMHFGTFRLSLEGIDAPQEALAAARNRHGVSADRFLVPRFGETVAFRRDGGAP